MINILLVLAGLLALYYGANWLVRGSSRLAASFHVSPLIIGLTIVALGTSMPELLVSVTAAIEGQSDISVGNVVGSNIANIGLILGLSGLIRPLRVHASIVRREIPIMITVAIFSYLIILDAEIGRLDGVLLLFGYIAFNGLFYFLATQERAEIDLDALPPTDVLINRWWELGYVIVGIIVLMLGANWLIDGSVAIARSIGVSELVIGLTMVAVGTSLPELATSVVAAIKKESDIAIGNVVGSNIANILLILGATVVIRPISIDPGLRSFEFFVMIGFSLLLYPFARNETLGRRESAVFLGAYVAFIAFAFLA